MRRIIINYTRGQVVTKGIYFTRFAAFKPANCFHPATLSANIPWLRVNPAKKVSARRTAIARARRRENISAIFVPAGPQTIELKRAILLTDRPRRGTDSPRKYVSSTLFLDVNTDRVPAPQTFLIYYLFCIPIR